MTARNGGGSGLTPPFHDACVVERRMLSPNMVRLTLAGPTLANFPTTGIPDEYLRLFFPDPETGELVLPIISADGRWSYREGKPPVRCSTYTVRHFDAVTGQLDIDFVLHPGGVASDWAAGARAGTRIIINEPRGLYAPPQTAEWLLLASDSTGLPALCRILEQVPKGMPCRVYLETLAPEECGLLPEHPRSTVTWLSGTGNGATCRSLLADAVRLTPLPTAPGYIWAAAERDAVRAIRRLVRTRSKQSSLHHQLVAYWIDDRTSWRQSNITLSSSLEAESRANW